MPDSLNSPESIAEELTGNAVLTDDVVCIAMNDFSIHLRSNSNELLDWCRYYFSAVLQAHESLEPNIEIIAIERHPITMDIEFKNWLREDKNKAQKDAIYDIPGARVLKKVRTGMVFLQSQSHLIAAGECLNNKNQIINFINTQYMSWIQNHQGIICHAAGIVYHNQALGMAGFSGGGKSTLMLHMLARDGSRFLSNDRLFLQRDTLKKETLAIGIPKLPRINPGTIIHNKKLENLISSERREALLKLPVNELWELEEKYDVIVDECYGQNKIQYQEKIHHFLILNWSHNSHEDVQLEQVDLNQRRDLLSAVMKSPGPFYQYHNGEFYQHLTPLDENSYLDIFKTINVYEAKGKVDFQALSQLCYQQLLS